MPAEDILMPSLSLQPVAMPLDVALHTRIRSMTAFQGELYLGLDPTDGQSAAIWCYDPTTQDWQPALKQAQASDPGRRRLILPPVLPTDFPKSSQPEHHAGFPSMAVFQGHDDNAPCLYVATQSLMGAHLLRSEDGRSFEAVLSIPVSEGYLGLTALTVWNDRLVMTSGAHLPEAEADTSMYPRGSVLASRNPARTDQWETLSVSGFGDPGNQAITALAVHEGNLCAGTSNPEAGFQLWSLEPDTKAGKSAWVCLLSDGASRYGMNAQVALLKNHQDHLWIGTAVEQSPPEDFDWPAAELLRLEPGGDWELIAGETRLTPQGLRLPFSLLGPGLDDPAAIRFSAMATMPDDRGLVLGCEPLAGLWISHDGEHWEPIPLEDMPEEGGAVTGVTALTATDDRLWIGIDGKLFRFGGW